MSKETEPQVFPLTHGRVVWLPNAEEAQPAQMINIPTLIGTIFWVPGAKEMEDAFGDLLKEIEGEEARNPISDARSFLNAYLPLLWRLCLQDAANQALREAIAIVQAKELNHQTRRSKHLESVAEKAREDSLRRLAGARLYRPVRRGERVRDEEETLAKALGGFFDSKADLKSAIRDTLREKKALTLRAIARKLNLGKEHRDRERDTGIKKVEKLLRELFPGKTPQQGVAELVKEIEAEDRQPRGENQIGKKNSRRKTK